VGDILRHGPYRRYSMPAPLCRFVADESGVTAIEYSLIAGLISVVIIAALTPVGVALNAVYAGFITVLAAAL
jgi:pilus assembly protein Flp/PilA